MQSAQYSCDTLAAFLADVGRQAAVLPPAWDGARISHLVAGPQGEFIGKMLPGRGLLLWDDLKNYGITKPVPYVFERSLAFYLRDLLRSERGAISTYAGLLAARAAGKHGVRTCGYNKSFSGTIGRWASIFTQAGNPPPGSFTAIPGGAAYDQTSVGALNNGFAEPTNPDKAFLLSFGMGCRNLNFLRACLIDMLVAASNIDTNLNTAQTVNTTALTRNTTGAGVMAYCEVTSTLSTTASNLSLNKYTNQANTANQSSVANAMIASVAAPQIPYSTVTPFMALAAGDYGIRSVEEVTFSAAMGGTGKVALVLCMPVMWIPGLPAGFAAKRDDTSNINGAVQLAQTSGDRMGCLSLLVCFGGTTTMEMFGDLDIAVGS